MEGSLQAMVLLHDVACQLQPNVLTYAAALKSEGDCLPLGSHVWMCLTIGCLKIQLMIHAYHNFLLEIADLENTVYPVFGRTRRCHSQKLDYVPILWDKHTNITRSLVLDSGHKDCKQCWYDQDGHACFDDDSRIFQQLDISKKSCWTS